MITFKAFELNVGCSSSQFTYLRSPRHFQSERFKLGYSWRNKFMVYSSDRNQWNHEGNNWCEKQRKIHEHDEDDEDFSGLIAEKVDRMVCCEVEVISWRERRIKAEIEVNADIDLVWNALTDYERLADFVPNLVSR